MKDIIEKLIEFSQKYGVMPSISFKHECGNVWIKVRLKRNEKAIDKLFYYVPVGKHTIDNFRIYNEYFDEEILEMIGMLEGDE